MTILPEFGFDYWSILFYGFSLIALVQLLYVTIIYSRLAFYKEKGKPSADDLPPVSVIIAARNEADNLYNHLPILLEQDYPNYEVIVVVNQSVDESKHILMAYQQHYPHLRLTIIESNKHLRPGKKLSLSIGIKAARHEHLLFTDADCKPVNKSWLKSMASHFTTQHQIVLGYAPYNKTKGLLNFLIRLDTLHIGINYLSFALSRLPYMGVGRNMAYTKTAYEKADGFKSHYALPSGDDDLFIQSAAKKKNYTINIDPESYMYSPAEETWESWLRQKARHYTTSSRYNVIKKTLLGIYPLTMILLVLSFIILLFDENFRWLSLIIFTLIIGIKWLIQGKCYARLQEKKWIYAFPFYDILYAFFSPIIFYYSDTNNNKRW